MRRGVTRQGGDGGQERRSTMFNMVDRYARRFPRCTRLAGEPGPVPPNFVLVVHGVSESVNSIYINIISILELYKINILVFDKTPVR
jgi:hypothetical protein